jgi:hypothetical protein
MEAVVDASVRCPPCFAYLTAQHLRSGNPKLLRKQARITGMTNASLLARSEKETDSNEENSDCSSNVRDDGRFSSSDLGTGDTAHSSESGARHG